MCPVLRSWVASTRPILLLVSFCPLSAKGLLLRDMCTASVTWKCPNCGTPVTLAALCGRNGAPADDRTLDRLAQALCGCWVSRLSEKDLARLLRAVIIGDEAYYEGPWPEPAVSN